MDELKLILRQMKQRGGKRFYIAADLIVDIGGDCHDGGLEMQAKTGRCSRERRGSESCVTLGLNKNNAFSHLAWWEGGMSAMHTVGWFSGTIWPLSLEQILVLM